MQAGIMSILPGLTDYRRFTQRADVNELLVRIPRCVNLTAPKGAQPAVFFSFQLPNQDSVVTVSARGRTLDLAKAHICTSGHDIGYL